MLRELQCCSVIRTARSREFLHVPKRPVPFGRPNLGVPTGADAVSSDYHACGAFEGSGRLRSRHNMPTVYVSEFRCSAKAQVTSLFCRKQISNVTSKPRNRWHNKRKMALTNSASRSSCQCQETNTSSPGCGKRIDCRPRTVFEMHNAKPSVTAGQRGRSSQKTRAGWRRRTEGR